MDKTIITIDCDDETIVVCDKEFTTWRMFPHDYPIKTKKSELIAIISVPVLQKLMGMSKEELMDQHLKQLREWGGK